MTTTSPFVYATSNLQGTDPRPQIEATAKGVVRETGALVVGWQEGPKNAVDLLKRALGKKWAHVACAEVPISYRSDVFDLVAHKSIRVHDGEAHVTPSRWINSATLRSKRTGVVFTVLNTHVVHHIDGHGHPMKYKGSDIKKFARQPARAVKHFRMLRDAIVTASKAHPVIWSGDLNVDFEDDRKVKYKDFPYAKLHDVTTFAIPTGPTEGGRTIDWTGYSGDGIRPTRNATRKGRINSDHSPVMTEFVISQTAGGTKPVNRGTRIEAAIKSLKTANRPTQKSKTDAALALLESIPGLK